MGEVEFNPVILIGAARSGTTLLGELLSQSPEVAYWLEPKYIWRYGNPSAKDDIRTKAEATQKVKHYIYNTFLKHKNKKAKDIFIEKTPSNVFRIEFINEIFPNAKYVHIIRDGRDVSLSAEKKWTSTPDRSALLRRLTSNEIPLSEIAYYGIDFFRDVIGRIFLPKKGFIWGPHFQGIREFRRSHTIIETCAQQWLSSVEHSLNEFNNIDSSRIFEIRYEKLIQQPDSVLSELSDFIGLKDSDPILNYAYNIIRANIREHYTEEEQMKIDKILPIIYNQLKALQYI